MTYVLVFRGRQFPSQHHNTIHNHFVFEIPIIPRFCKKSRKLNVNSLVVNEASIVLAEFYLEIKKL